MKVFDPLERMGVSSSSRDWQIVVFQGRTVAWMTAILLRCINYARRRHGGRGYVQTRAGLKTPLGWYGGFGDYL
jgi:hypothetical protein